MHKSEIRELLRPLRRLIGADYRQRASLAAAEHFIQSPLFQTHQKIACYLPLPEEIDTLPIIEALWQQQKSCYLPVIEAKAKDKKLAFALYQKGEKLELNRFRILEPQASKTRVRASELEVVLVPLLGFDEAGNRLGTGGGYYDITFSFLREEKKTKPLLIGLGYELQRVEALPQEDFDLRLDGVITEEKLRLF